MRSYLLLQGILLLFLCMGSSACSLPGTPTATPALPTTATPTQLATASNTALRHKTATPIATASATPQPLPTASYEPMLPEKGATFVLTSTSSIPWTTDVLEIQSNKYYEVLAQPQWLSNTVVELASYSSAYVSVDIADAKNPRWKSRYENDEQNSYVPNKRFAIQCGDGMKLYRVSDNTVLSKTALYPPGSSSVMCSVYIQWAPDDSIAAFSTDEQTLYIWRSDGSPPQKIAEDIGDLSTSWSPNSDMLAFAQSNTFAEQTGVIHIVNRQGKLLYAFQMKMGAEYTYFSWLNDNVLVSHGKETRWYYDVHTGQFLFSWQRMPGGYIGNQIYFSPDQRWVFMDELSQRHAGDPIFPKKYRLYDLQQKKETSLLDLPYDYLGFAGWSLDGSQLYLVRRARQARYQSAPETPFGLLAYDLHSQKFKLLFKDAVQVTWNADQSRAFVAFAARTNQGITGLDGGIWNPATQTLQGRWHLSDQMVYYDPAYDDFSGPFPGPIPIAWSYTGQQLIVYDAYGRLKLLDEQGTEKVLTEGLAPYDAANRERITLCWSPDDQHVLMVQGNRAWIVHIPER